MSSVRGSFPCCALVVCLTVLLAGCGGTPASPPASPPANPGSPPTAPADSTPTSSTETPISSTETPTEAQNIHSDTYSVTLYVSANPVNEEPEVSAEIPSLSTANLTNYQREQVSMVIEAGQTEPWSGLSNETPPRNLRLLVAATDRLPPSPESRTPSEAWRVARETTGYVAYQNTTYRLQMVKVAP